jgi:transcriptional regulator with XRE-family HTH domain
MDIKTQALLWKLRRIAAGLRQQDVASRVGIATSRYSAIERGELQPNDEDKKFIENALPKLELGVQRSTVR